MSSPDEDEARARAYQVDLTPTPLVRQGLTFARAFLDLKPRVVLDTHAGCGVFGMVGREVWPEAFMWGMEIRDEEQPHLARNYHWHAMGDWRASLERAVPARGIVDLVVTNPAFRDTYDVVEQGLEIAPVVMLYAKDGFGQRGEDAAEWLKKFPPLLQLRICGAVAHRGGSAADGQDYSWFLWANPGGLPEWLTKPMIELNTALPMPFGHRAWPCMNLPRLDGPDRRWSARPGTENASPPTPQAAKDDDDQW